MNGLAMLFPRERDMRALSDKCPLHPPLVESRLSRLDAIWASQLLANRMTGNPEAYESLCKWHPGTRRGGYFPLTNTREEDYGFVNWDTVVANPTWFLPYDRSKPGSIENRRVYNATDKHPRYYLNVRIPECREFIVSEAFNWAMGEAHRPPLTQPGRSPHFLAGDNVCIGQARMADIVGEEHVAEWDNAMYRLLAELKAALNSVGKKLIVNHKLPLDTATFRGNRLSGAWRDLTESVDGVMSEDPLGGPGEWLQHMCAHTMIAAGGTIDWWTCYPATHDGADGNREFLYHYCSYLLTYKPGLSLFSANWPLGEDSPPITRWNGAYDLCLGEPTEALGYLGLCAARAFQNGLVVVNPTAWPVEQRPVGHMPPRSGSIMQ